MCKKKFDHGRPTSNNIKTHSLDIYYFNTYEKHIINILMYNCVEWKVSNIFTRMKSSFPSYQKSSFFLANKSEANESQVSDFLPTLSQQALCCLLISVKIGIVMGHDNHR